jgi:hypothetical protein
MAESLRGSVQDLEAALTTLGRRVAYPELPDASGSVVAHLSVPERRGRVVPFRRPAAASLRPLARPAWIRVAVAAAVVALLMSGILTFSPSARSAVADFLGLRGERIHVGKTVPSATLRPLGAGLDLGEQTTLAAAGSRAGYPVLVPTDPALGPPDEVYVRSSGLGVQVSLVYRGRAGLPKAPQTGVGLLVTEFRARLNEQFIYKAIGPGAMVEAVSVNGHIGFWISGRPHDILYVGPDGQPIPDTVRLAANVLVWEQGTVTVRIESLLNKAEAVRIAESVR